MIDVVEMKNIQDRAFGLAFGTAIGDATQLSSAIMRAITKHLSDKSEEISLIQHIVNEHIREW